MTKSRMSVSFSCLFAQQAVACRLFDNAVDDDDDDVCGCCLSEMRMKVKLTLSLSLFLRRLA